MLLSVYVSFNLTNAQAISLIQAITWTVMPKEPKKWKTLIRQTSIAPVRE